MYRCICLLYLITLGECCPNIEPVQDFDISGILGHWHTIQKTGAVFPCLTLNFTRSSANSEEFDVVETSQSTGLINTLGLQHESYLRGKLRVTDSPGIFHLSLPITTWKLTVFGTDYDNYVAFLLCNKGIVTTSLVIISSRTTSLSPKQLESIYAKLLKYNINPYVINTVRQHGCSQHGERGIVVKTASNIFGGIANLFKSSKSSKSEKEEEVQYDIDIRTSLME
ncbi:uncharacterized protein LOC116161199 [Photinus pyralis]|uniref:Uncharacterized protein n=1 Tax=Photinus pyralis TaxID=7054 RepID=A0A1Y1LW43_PHOPY|nr:uncharacterized protein LOC116161199 [Photinus pyralis]